MGIESIPRRSTRGSAIVVTEERPRTVTSGTTNSSAEGSGSTTNAARPERGASVLRASGIAQHVACDAEHPGQLRIGRYAIEASPDDEHRLFDEVIEIGCGEGIQPAPQIAGDGRRVLAHEPSEPILLYRAHEPLLSAKPRIITASAPYRRSSRVSSSLVSQRVGQARSPHHSSTSSTLSSSGRRSSPSEIASELSSASM